MKIETALKKLEKEYERAKKMEFVRDPLAYALYQTWKAAEKKAQLSRNKESEDYGMDQRGGEIAGVQTRCADVF